MTAVWCAGVVVVLALVAEGVTPVRGPEEVEWEPDRELVHLVEPNKMGEFL